MTKISKLIVIAVFAMYAAGVAAGETDCRACDPQKADSSSSHRDQLKTERAKYDRENEKVTARPWDVNKDDKPLPDKSR
jgi:hypothetical protein